MEHDLDDAVVLEGRQSDDLRCSGQNDPESWMSKDFFEVHDDRWLVT